MTTNDRYTRETADTVFEKQLHTAHSCYWNGDILIFDMWREGGELYISGAGESGYVFRQRVHIDSYVSVKQETTE